MIKNGLAQNRSPHAQVMAVESLVNVLRGAEIGKRHVGVYKSILPPVLSVLQQRLSAGDYTSTADVLKSLVEIATYAPQVMEDVHTQLLQMLLHLIRLCTHTVADSYGLPNPLAENTQPHSTLTLTQKTITEMAGMRNIGIELILALLPYLRTRLIRNSDFGREFVALLYALLVRFKPDSAHWCDDDSVCVY